MSNFEIVGTRQAMTEDILCNFIPAYSIIKEILYEYSSSDIEQIWDNMTVDKVPKTNKAPIINTILEQIHKVGKLDY